MSGAAGPSNQSSDAADSELEHQLCCVVCRAPIASGSADELRRHIKYAHIFMYQCGHCHQQLECDGDVVFGECCPQFSNESVIVNQGKNASIVEKLVTMFTQHSIYYAAGKLGQVIDHLVQVMLHYEPPEEEGDVAAPAVAGGANEHHTVPDQELAAAAPAPPDLEPGPGQELEHDNQAHDDVIMEHDYPEHQGDQDGPSDEM